MSHALVLQGEEKEQGPSWALWCLFSTPGSQRNASIGYSAPAVIHVHAFFTYKEVVKYFLPGAERKQFKTLGKNIFSPIYCYFNYTLCKFQSKENLVSFCNRPIKFPPNTDFSLLLPSNDTFDLPLSLGSLDLPGNTTAKYREVRFHRGRSK